MKINTTWSQRDWNNALKKVWKLSRNFEEILNFGLENNFITSSDIIHASDIYKDPNKEYDDDEVKEMIQSRDIRDIMSILQDEYSLYEILDELPTHDILENIDASDRLDSLENTWELEKHDEETKEIVYKEYIDEWIDECQTNEINSINNLSNINGDELHKFICNVIGCGYYDQNEFNKCLKKFIEKLNKNSYGIKY